MFVFFFSAAVTKLHLTFDSSWPKESVKIGQVAGVAVDTNGSIYIFHRGSRVWDEKYEF